MWQSTKVLKALSLEEDYFLPFRQNILPNNGFSIEPETHHWKSFNFLNIWKLRYFGDRRLIIGDPKKEKKQNSRDRYIFASSLIFSLNQHYLLITIQKILIFPPKLCHLEKCLEPYTHIPHYAWSIPALLPSSKKISITLKSWGNRKLWSLAYVIDEQRKKLLYDVGTL